MDDVDSFFFSGDSEEKYSDFPLNPNPEADEFAEMLWAMPQYAANNSGATCVQQDTSVRSVNENKSNLSWEQFYFII